MNRKVYAFWSVLVAAAAFRLWQSFFVVPPHVGDCLHLQIQGTAVINDVPQLSASAQILVARVIEAHALNGLSCGGDYTLRLKTKLYPRFAYNDTILFSGRLSSPYNFSSADGRTFDLRGYLAKDDIFYQILGAQVTPADATIMRTVASSPSIGIFGRTINSISTALFSLRRSFVGNLNAALGEPHAALAAGLVVGEKSALGSDLLNDFRTVGLIHIVVLSGYNITIVGDAMRRLLSFLPRVWGILIGGIGILLFGVMVGGGATVVRSCIMATIALSAAVIRRDYSVVRALAFAALLMLIENPLILLHDPSFQLSFLATLGLILLAAPIERRLSFIPDAFGMRGVVAATLATQVFVSPYILYMMGQLSIIGVVVNILVLPLIP
ncbi:MAG: ComEC/Rec2 family competence protein, partial [Patescibacteria group bacterium]|nr:ComEC/Rec2 family competence protein [Patescibacteria group bacterium]